MKNRSRYMVFQFHGTLNEMDIKIPEGVHWKWMSQEDVDHFFAGDPWRRKTFAKFLRQGYRGVLLHQGERWLSYGWMSTPVSPPPPHLPKRLKSYRSFWFFYDHTHSDFRSRGYQKLTLRLRVRRALTEEQHIGPIFIDIEKENLPSYRALKSLRFEENGVLTVYKIGIPKVWSHPFGRWHTEEKHPPDLTDTVALELAASQVVEEAKSSLPVPVQIEVQEFLQPRLAKPPAATVPNPLFLPGWQEYNRVKWGLDPVRVKFYGQKEACSLEAIFSVNRRGQLRLPPGNPYLPLHFQMPPQTRYEREYRYWVDMGQRLADEMRARGMAGALALPTEIADARPWQWTGFRIGVRYSLHMDFPYSLDQVDGAIRNRVRKALKNNYQAVRATDVQHVHECLQATSERQQFHNHVTAADLQLARQLLGDDQFRMYVCYAPAGEPVSAQIRLHAPGTRALVLYAGTKREHLQQGVNQLLFHFAMEDVQAAGATGIDFVGANIKNVTLAKVDWGGTRLVPYYTVEAYNPKALARWLVGCWEYGRSKRKREEN